MDELFEVKNVTVSIHRSPRDVYDFVVDGANLPRWASGVGKTVAPEGDAWVAEGPLGKVRLRFAPRNDLGVLDHEVTLPSGQVVLNPMRVLPNGKGSTVIFTVLRLAGVSEKQFEADVQHVTGDLDTLRDLLEAKS